MAVTFSVHRSPFTVQRSVRRMAFPFKDLHTGVSCPTRLGGPRGWAAGCWRATLRRSSHRATSRNSEKVWLRQWDLEGSCLQLHRRVVVDGWFSVLSACRPKALQATPLTKQWVKRSCYAVAATSERSPPEPAAILSA